MKTITRQVRLYEHIVGKIEQDDDGNMKVVEYGRISVPYKLGIKTFAKYAPNYPSDAKILACKPVTNTYACSLEKFLEIAEKVD